MDDSMGVGHSILGVCWCRPDVSIAATEMVRCFTGRVSMFMKKTSPRVQCAWRYKVIALTNTLYGRKQT